MRLIDADALKRKVIEWMPCDLCGIGEREPPFEADIVVSLMMEIEEAPTIEPEPHWIPVSERLPKYGITVLTIKSDEDYEINHVIDDESGEWLYDGVIAWMSLPKPYKAESEDKI